MMTTIIVQPQIRTTPQKRDPFKISRKGVSILLAPFFYLLIRGLQFGKYFTATLTRYSFAIIMILVQSLILKQET